jgi:predicted Zn-dependent protease
MLLALASAVLAASVSWATPTLAVAYSHLPCRWPSSSVKFYANTSGAHLTAFTSGASAWTGATAATLTRVTSYSSAQFYGVAAYDGNTGYDGQTTWTCNLLLQFSTVNVVLNRTYMDSYGATEKKVIAMHELGHAMGLDHSTASGYPVMASSAGNSYNHGTTTLKSDGITSTNTRY